MDYKEYNYLYPPRPENKIPRGMLSFYEKRGYWAQVKKNGTCTVIFAKGNTVIFKTRHADDHKQWSPTPEHIRFFQGSDNWNVYCAELLHNKTTHIKNQLYIFDKIVDDGIHLVGTTFEDRQLILQSQWEGDFEEKSHQTRVHDYISVAENLVGDFDVVFDELLPEDEGLVIKNPNGILEPCFKDTSNNRWQVKCRIPTKNYSFVIMFAINTLIFSMGVFSCLGSSIYGMI